MEPIANLRVPQHNTVSIATQTENLDSQTQSTNITSAEVSLFTPADRFKSVRLLIQALDLFAAVKHPEFNAMCLSNQIEDRLAITKLWLEIKNLPEAESNLKWLSLRNSELTSAERGQLALCKAYTAILNYNREEVWIAQIQEALTHQLSFDVQLWLLRLLSHSKNMYFIHFSWLFNNCLRTKTNQAYNVFIGDLGVFLSTKPPWPETQLSLLKLLQVTANVSSQLRTTSLTLSQETEINLVGLNMYYQQYKKNNNMHNLETQTGLLRMANAITAILQNAAKQPQGDYSSFLHFLAIKAQATAHIEVSHDEKGALYYCDLSLEFLQQTMVAPAHTRYLKLGIYFQKSTIYDKLCSPDLTNRLLAFREVNHYAQLAYSFPKLSERAAKDCSWVYFNLAERLAMSGNKIKTKQYLKKSLTQLRKINPQDLNIGAINDCKQLLIEFSQANDSDNPFRFINFSV
jgi:hypothetical protein